MNRGPVAEINLPALRHNLRIVKRIVGDRTIIAVVKADAYGHGSNAVSKELVTSGIGHLAVAYAGEGRQLREGGITAAIIVLFDRADIPVYFDYGLTPVIQDMKTAREFSREAARRKTAIGIHLKVDTGMGRIGFSPERAVSEAFEIAGLQGLRLEGLLSHFSEADLSDRSYAVRQLEIFSGIGRGIGERLGYDLIRHIGNSAAVLTLEDALLDAVRPGIMLYGCSPFREDHGLEPLMTVKAKVLVVRDLAPGTPISYGRTFVTKRKSRIALVPVGYADGYNRLFSNNADILVRGRRAPVVGRICMDLTMIDVTDIDGVSEGDEVVLLGKQGDEMITAGELASRIGTIPYEIVTALGSRATKEYRR